MYIKPNAYFKGVKDISIKFLKENKINALILDVDNTLIDYNKNLQKGVEEWAKNMHEGKIKLYILSNTNNESKVEQVSKKLNIPYMHFAKKPFKGGFKKVKKILQENSENIGVVGDQIFTDIVGGNRCKMFTILVDPVKEKDYWYTAWKRPIENKIKKKVCPKIGLLSD